MGFMKKILLAIVIIAGVMTLVREFREYGIQVGLVLAAGFLFSTVFLWHWASGYMPKIGKLLAIVVMMIFTLVYVGTVEYAMADSMRVDLIEVVRTTIRHSPWFYQIAFLGAGIKVFFWSWLFSGVREENAAKALQA